MRCPSPSVDDGGNTCELKDMNFLGVCVCFFIVEGNRAGMQTGRDEGHQQREGRAAAQPRAPHVPGLPSPYPPFSPLCGKSQKTNCGQEMGQNFTLMFNNSPQCH